MDNTTLKYPIGIQTFSDIIEGGYVYVDKTEYVYKMTRYRYVFLSRPRRFGKSLLTSTLKSFFEGRKELFKGLAIEKLETEWVQRPVLRFDLSGAKHVDKFTLEQMLDRQLRDYEAVYGRNESNVTLNDRLASLMQNAFRQTGQKVALLIDEYDAPLLDVMHEDEQLPVLRNVMRNFYSPIKSCDEYIHFAFLTGITKFSQVSIFSELNNLKNISMDKNYAAICGITEEEMLTQLGKSIDELAAELELTKEQTMLALKNNYDGYRFSWPSPDIYNPFSLLNALDDKKIGSYWFATGTPTYLIEMLRKFDVAPSELCSPIQAKASSFDAPTENMTEITPLLYQSGYSTIKGYDHEDEMYTLDIPNREIRTGLMESLLTNFLGVRLTQGNAVVVGMQKALRKDDIDQMFQLLKKFFASVQYVNGVNAAENKEGHWQQLLYVIFAMMGAKCSVEVHTNTGRVDLVAQTARYLYLIEVKLNQSAEAAMEQIDLKEYADSFALCELPVVKVGVNFDQEKRNITDWQIVPAEAKP